MTLAGRILNRSRDLLFAPPLQSFWLDRLRGRVICLLYHRVDDPSNNVFLGRGGSPVVSPCEFRADMRFLAGTGGIFLTFRDLADGKFPREDQHGIIVCFDDCFRDNYEVGLPILEEFSIKATFFQTTALVEADNLLWEHLLYWHSRDAASAARLAAIAAHVLEDVPVAGNADSVVQRLREDVPLQATLEVLARASKASDDRAEASAAAAVIYPTSDHLRATRRLGHEIGSHGHNHYMRRNIDASTFAAELETSAGRIEDILSEDATTFSYPFNSHSPGDDQACGRFYRAAATVELELIGRDCDPMWLPRFTWPGQSRNSLRRYRWLLSGRV